MGELEINLNGNIAEKKHLYTLIVQYEDTDAGELFTIQII